MKIFVQLAIIFILCMAGNAVSFLLPFTFPGSIVAMLLLFALFCLKILSPAQLDPTGSWFQRNMAFFFLPSNILIMKEFELISQVWLQVLIICVISTFVTFTVAAYTATAVMKLQEKAAAKKRGGDNNSSPATLSQEAENGIAE